MNTLTIGIVQPGKANNFVLNSETKYVAICGTKPEVSFSIDYDRMSFCGKWMACDTRTPDPSASSEAISYMQKLVTQIFDQIKYLKIEEGNLSPLHIRLVTTPFELAQLPFEFVSAPVAVAGAENVPLLTLPNREISLTREVRQESEVRYEWPAKPRILFVWAQPGGEEMTVPHEEHLAVLKSLVSPLAMPRENQVFPEPCWEKLLTELPNASIQSIKDELAAGRNENSPYTHLHILAHGGIREQFTLTDFQLILCKDEATAEQQKVNGKKLAEALIPDEEASKPTVVSLSVCDSAHLGNTIQPSGSLVYQLHMAGIPCVFASQFPLTQTGSVTLLRELYGRLLSSCDPREALYDTRIELRKEPTHDWASLVAYARFPDDIDKQLDDARLKAHFGSMKVTNAWVDHTFSHWNELDETQNSNLLRDLEGRLIQSINDLSSLLSPVNESESGLATVALRTEHLGLMASAYNRLAEYYFRQIEFNPGSRSELIQQSREALNQAKEFYKSGIEEDPTNHWTAMQYLSLKAVSEGTLKEDIGPWYIVKFMAEREERRASDEKDRMWAWGTLAELYLLQPLTKQAAPTEKEIESSIALSIAYIQKMAGTGEAHNSVKESTVRQFERYIHWWPLLHSNVYPAWLKNAAVEIRSKLPSLTML